jgi:hypothetical protein
MKYLYLIFVVINLNSFAQVKDSTFCVFPEKDANMIDPAKNGNWFTQHCINNIDSLVCGDLSNSKFILQLTIEKNGIVSSAELIQSTEGQECRLNLCQPLNEAPKFTPAMEKGKACRQRMRLPLNINLN